MLIRSVGSLVSGFAVFSVLLGSARADGYSSCKTINSIAYCKEVDSLGYSHPPSSGQYDDVVDVNVKGCVCKKATKTFSGPLGPFSEDVCCFLCRPGSVCINACFSSRSMFVAQSDSSNLPPTLCQSLQRPNANTFAGMRMAICTGGTLKLKL